MLREPRKTKDDIVQWIRDYFAANGPDCNAVVGISGGKDSSIVAALCAEALGKDRVIGVMMPNGEQSDIDDSKRIIHVLGIRHAYINIYAAVRALCAQIESNVEVTQHTRINLPPRLRMAALYGFAQSLPSGGRVANTSNLAEDYVGYSTKFGDSAGDFSPLANLMVSEVKQLGFVLPVPTDMVVKEPADGLCGLTDEENLGFTYAQVEDYILYGSSGVDDIDKKINELHIRNMHKLQPMPCFGASEAIARTMQRNEQ